MVKSEWKRAAPLQLTYLQLVKISHQNVQRMPVEAEVGVYAGIIPPTMCGVSSLIAASGTPTDLKLRSKVGPLVVHQKVLLV